MKRLVTYLMLAGAATAGSVHAADAPSPLVGVDVMKAAGVDLGGQGFPGKSVEHWLAKPAGEVVYLQGNWGDLLSELHQVGDVSVLSGNETVMHLATGQYDPLRGEGGNVLVLNQGIDLRMFTGRWEYGLAVLPGGSEIPGFAFFNGAGVPVHRILLTESSNVDAFTELVADYTGPKPEFSPSEAAPADTEPPSEETKKAFLDAWRALEDAHHFNGLLRKHKLSRTDALRVGEGEFTAQLDPALNSSLFSQLLDQQISIIFFALNNGCVQISTGALLELNQKAGTLELAERDSRAIIRLADITEAWRVTKPTESGPAHSLEFYNAEGEPVAYVFGQRQDNDENAENFEKFAFSLPLVNREGKLARYVSPEGEKEASNSSDGYGETVKVAKVDTFNMPRRLRSQLNYTVKRMLEFDQDGDDQLTVAELPQRLSSLLEKGDQNGDARLDEDELTAMAYAQIQAREAIAEAESSEKEKK